MDSRVTDQVSVLMCVYNTPLPYLSEAVKSICGQTYSDIEFVIVDDASDDIKVREYLREIQESDDRVKLLRNNTNLGLTKSLNVGLTCCRGKYVARMDADDISLPERIAIQVKYLEKHSEVVMVGGFITVFGDGIEERVDYPDERIYNDYEIYKIKSLLHHSGPPHPTFMFRNDFLQSNNIRYRESIRKAQDYGMIVDILKENAKIGFIEEPLLKYRIHSDQISFNSGIEQKVYQYKVSCGYLKDIFSNMSDVECAAIAMLGCDQDVDTLVAAMEKDEALNVDYMKLVSYTDRLRDSRIFIKSIKKLLKTNRINQQYDNKKFERELRSAWWKKALRTSIRRGKFWGMSFFTIFSYRFTL